MDIVQTFYDNLASEYDKLFADWQAAMKEQGELLHNIFQENGFDTSARVLDCACGIGTQAIGLAALGYCVSASDISGGALEQARRRAENCGVQIDLRHEDFCTLEKSFSKPFDIVICMDNALPHMLSPKDLAAAVKSITGQMADGGLFVASIRDYDALLLQKPSYSAPYIHKTDWGKRVSFQTWDWEGERYKLTQYIIEDEQELKVNKFDCEYRATTREELTRLFAEQGCGKIRWSFPAQTGFYQPILIVQKV